MISVFKSQNNTKSRQTSVSILIRSENLFCAFLAPRVSELHEIVSKNSSLLYAGCTGKEQEVSI